MAKVTLTLATNKTVTIDVDSTQEFYDLMNREGEYSSGWLEVRGTWVNLAAVVEIRATGL